MTDQNQPIIKPAAPLARYRRILSRNPVAFLLLVILCVGLLIYLVRGPHNSGSAPSVTNSVQSTISNTAASAQLFKDANAAVNRGDATTAIHIIRPLADQGDAKAQDFLGTMYWAGEGVPKDYVEAAKWWRKAADQGNVTAQISLSSSYRDGEGVPQDYVRAYMWLTLAAQSNEPAEDPTDYSGAQQASMLRPWVAQQMTPAQIAEATRLASEWKPVTEPLR